MAFIRNELMHQKILESEAEVNDFLRENEIDESFMIQSFVLSTERFKEESEAIEYIDSRHYYADDIEVTEEHFIFNVREVNQFRLPLQSIEVSRGVTILIGELRPVDIMPRDEDFRFSIKPLDIKNFSNKAPILIEVAKVVKGHHPRYGEVEITEEDLKSMERNFKEKVTGVDLSINKDHEKVEALGWFKDVFLSFDGKTLLAEVSWCPEGVSVLKDKSFRYFSPEFSFNYTHPHNGSSTGATLTGGALTNYPFLKMEAITELNNKNPNKGKTVEQISLKAHEDKMLDLNSKITSLEKDSGKSKELIASMKTVNTELNDKITKMEEDKVLAEKNAKHEMLFNDGKISKAQLDALKEGKDLLEVLELNGKLHTESKGKDTKTDKVEGTLNEEEKEFCLKNDISEEDYTKYNKGK